MVSQQQKHGTDCGKKALSRLAVAAAFEFQCQTSEQSFVLDPLKSFGLQSQQFDVCTFV